MQLGFYLGERFYESEAIPKRARFPKNCFLYSNLLIDAYANPSLLNQMKQDLFLENIPSDIKNPLETEFHLQEFPTSIEKITLVEVVAMMIKHAKNIAEKQIKEQIKDAVMTVPSHWNIEQRGFLTDAAQIADLHVLSLIS
jgi:hypoxia up-regulated 1